MALPLYLEGEDFTVMLLSDSEEESEDEMPENTTSKAAQDPIVQGPAAQDKGAQGKATQDKTTQDKATQDKAAQDPTAHDTDSNDEASLKQKTEDAAANVPAHPIPAMQAPFAESLFEATTNSAEQKPKLRFADADERRAILLDAAPDASLPADLWRHRPGHVHHELWKLMAQISFGVYLLLGGMANSNIQVVNILQGHIDEVDEFLETAMEDVNTAIVDVQKRIQNLKLPLENRDTFEKMLEGRDFRLQIVTGNEKIEHICLRTALALEAYLDDVEEGLKATKEFAMYLNDQQGRPWREQRPSVVEIFDAMKGNAEGWYKAFVDLQDLSTNLESMLENLTRIVSEVDNIAGEVSRRTIGSMSELVPEEDPIDDDFLDDYLGEEVLVPEESVDDRKSQADLGDAFQLDLRASALMPLQLGLESFPVPPEPANASNAQTTDSKPASKPASRSDPHTADSEPANSSGRYSADSSHASKTSGKTSPRTESSRSRAYSDIQSQAHSAPTSPKSPSQKSPPSSPAAKDTLPQSYYQPPTKRESTLRRPIEILIAPEPVIVDDEYDDDDDDLDDGSNSILEDHDASDPDEDECLFVLQPRTYTPLPPAPLPSPMIREELESPKQQGSPEGTSLRKRLSLRGSNPPVSIQVPPRNANRPRPPAPPRVSTFQDTTSGYVSERERRPTVHSVTDEYTELSPPSFLNHQNTIASPLSDHQHHFRPVQASPHSPLQRPWTAGHTNPVPRPHTSAATGRDYQGQHHSNMPSGTTSRLSNGSRETENADGKTLKKKRSAFGWLKKAFALDEEERMLFEARRQQQIPMSYYDEPSPRFLDGRRLDEPRRY